MFRLNFWTRPFLGHHGAPSGHAQNVSAGAPIDYSGGGSASAAGGPYMPLPLSASPALMVLASGSESAGSGCRGTRTSTADEASLSDGKERRSSSTSAAPPPPPPGVISPHHHAAFGAFPFFRPAPTVSAATGSADTAAAAAAALQHQLPPIFSHLHQSLLRSHFDSAIAAAQLHQARLGAAALLGHRLAAASSGSIGRHHHHHDPATVNGPPAAAAAYPSAFLPTVKRVNATSGRAAPPAGFYQYMDDERSTTTTSPLNGGSSGRAHSGRPSPSSRMFGGSQHSAAAEDDDRRPTATAAAAAGSSGCSPLSFIESEPTSDHTRDAISPGDQLSVKVQHRWSDAEAGSREMVCPICREMLKPSDAQTHLILEFSQLKQLVNTRESSSCLEYELSGYTMDSTCCGAKHISARDATSKSRYDTYIRIRNNRENRLAKIRSRRKRLHDEMVYDQLHHQQQQQQQQQQHGVSLIRPVAVNGHKDGVYSQQCLGDAGGNAEITVDVIGVDDHDKENDWNSKSKPVPECENDVTKQMEDKSTRTDDNLSSSPALPQPSSSTSAAAAEAAVAVMSNCDVNANKDRFLCTICSQPFVEPLISVQCWHVHCERCWLQVLQNPHPACPQCDVTTTSASLQRIRI